MINLVKRILALVVALLLPIPVQAQTKLWTPIQDAQGFDKTAMDATFAIFGEYDNPKTKKHEEPFVCTGFIFQADATGYLIMSAGHCVDKDPADSTYSVAEQIGSPTMPVECVFARLVQGKDYGDVSIFHLTTTKKYPVLELGDESSEHLGSEIINPNFALGLSKQLAKGQIVSEPIGGLESCDMCQGQFILHETAGRGASGSPVISAVTHKVVGILVGEIELDGYTVEPISTAIQVRQEPNQYFELHRMPPPKKVHTGLFGLPSVPNEDE
jgi:hypothetical protein